MLHVGREDFINRRHVALVPARSVNPSHRGFILFLGRHLFSLLFSWSSGMPFIRLRIFPIVRKNIGFKARGRFALGAEEHEVIIACLADAAYVPRASSYAEKWLCVLDRTCDVMRSDRGSLLGSCLARA